MLLIYSSKITQRITYVFKHICVRTLGIEVGFTNSIEEFVSHSGPKLSYGKKSLGNEMFIQSYGLLLQHGFDSIDILVKNWDETSCFFFVGKASALPFDIFSASFYLLSRYEEYLPHVKDEKGRFLATESLAYKKNFLNKPVVDIWAYKFKEVLANAFTTMEFPKKSMEVCNLIRASQPFRYSQKGMIRTVMGYIKDLYKFNFKGIAERTSVLLQLKKDPYNTFDWVIKTIKNSKVKLIVFFLQGDAINYMEGTNSKRSNYMLLIKNIADYKEIGLLFSKDSLSNIEELKKEKEQLEAVTNKTLLNSLNVDYLVNMPVNYRYLIELEIKKDFTLVYENTPGFRASTCTPFLFYDLDNEILTPLLIHPVALTSSSFKRMSENKIDEIITGIYNSVKEVNGTFSMVFSNRDFAPNKTSDYWRKLFSSFSKT